VTAATTTGAATEVCQAALVVHRSGHVACLDDDCVVEEELHVLVVPCEHLEPHCCDEP
jgi:hypothetical protein